MIRGLPGSEEVLRVPEVCPLCGTDDFRIVHTERTEGIVKLRMGIEVSVLHVAKCSGCGLHFTIPRPGPDRLKVFYEKNESTEHKAAIIPEERLIIKQALTFLESSGKKGRLLDVGCSAGGFLAEASRAGWECYGVEIRTDDAEHVRKTHHIECVNGTFGEANFPSSFFDAVAFLDVLEHLLHPLDELREAYRCLKHDGAVLVRVPNFGFQLPKERVKFYLGTGEGRVSNFIHINHFTKRTLIEILRRAGFGEVHISCGESSLWMEDDLKHRLSNWLRIGYVNCAKKLYALSGLFLGHELLALARKGG